MLYVKHVGHCHGQHGEVEGAHQANCHVAHQERSTGNTYKFSSNVWQRSLIVGHWPRGQLTELFHRAGPGPRQSHHQLIADLGLSHHLLYHPHAPSQDQAGILAATRLGILLYWQVSLLTWVGYSFADLRCNDEIYAEVRVCVQANLILWQSSNDVKD